MTVRTKQPKQNSESTIVTFKSSLEEFVQLVEKGEAYHVRPRDVWGDVLDKACGSAQISAPVQREHYYLKSGRGKFTALLGDRIQEFTKHYKGHRKNYVVHIHRMDQMNGGRRNPSRRRGQSKPVTAEVNPKATSRTKDDKKGDKKPRLSDLGQEGQGQGNDPPATSPIRPIISPLPVDEDLVDTQEAHFVGSGWAGPSGFRNLHNSSVGGQQTHPVDPEIMSQDSQDSQEGLEDIKNRVVNRLRTQVQNGDIHRVRQELMKLKEQEQWLRTTRKAPLTFHMLQNVFLD